MLHDISIADYFACYAHIPIIDVRSPGEFKKGHIPNAITIPLFSDDERADIGTVYKQVSQEKAIELGYKYVNPKLQSFITKALLAAPSKKVVVHCWRGGMRSHAFAKHLAENGFDDVWVIEKGYKAYRNLVLSSFDAEVDLKVIGGYTGSGKTHLLKVLKDNGHQVIDLEGIANHKGSAFGSIGEADQPTIEQFENNLFEKWRSIDFTQPVFLEDESFNIGGVKLPKNLYDKMRQAVVYFLDIPKEKRATMLVDDYAKFDNILLKEGIFKITKRLGDLNTRVAIKALEQNDYFKVAMITLNYYDKSYLRGVLRRDKDRIVRIKLPDVNANYNADQVKRVIEEHRI